MILGSELLLPDHTFDWTLPITAYGALIEGSLGSPSAIVNTLVETSPLVLAGLSVALGFKAGLFNIGAQGQFLMGALGAVTVGVAVADQPPIIAIPLAIAGRDASSAAFWGFIPGILKAVSGAHEVVTTIMLNYIAICDPGLGRQRTAQGARLAVADHPRRRQRRAARSSSAATATSASSSRSAMVVVVRWLLYRTTLGFEIRTVGANPDAARYAGMRPRRLIVLTMSMCGAAGRAWPGTCDLLGVTHYDDELVRDDRRLRRDRGRPARPAPTRSGSSSPALLFGAMRAGAGLMQIDAGDPARARRRPPGDDPVLPGRSVRS